MRLEKDIQVNSVTFTIIHERATTVKVSKKLYNLLLIEEDGDYYTDHRNSYVISYILEEVKNKHITIPSSEVKVLKACEFLFSNNEIDTIYFIK